MSRTFLLLCIFLFLLVKGDACAEVIALGFPGENTAELDARFDRVLALHPAWIVILARANDALNPAKLLAPEISRKNLLDMISRSKEAGAHVVLVTVHAPDLIRLLKRHTMAEYENTPPAERIADLDRVICTLNRLPLFPQTIPMPQCHTEQTSSTMYDENGSPIGSSSGRPQLVCN